MICYEHLWCNSNTGKCETDNTGDKCSKGNECYSGLCIHSKCSGMKDNGDKCTTQIECLSGQCHSGVCKGLMRGLPCYPKLQYGRQCDKGLFCSPMDKACVPQLQEKEDCFAHLDKTSYDKNIICSGGFVCDVNANSTSGKCTRLFSIPKDHSCQRSDVCLLGLSCQNGICTDNYLTCDLENNLDCPLDSYCMCEQGKETGTCQQTINYDCKYEMDKYVDCLDENSCNLETKLIEGTCSYEQCYQQLLNLECCKNKNNNTSTHYVLNGMECSECNMNLTYAGLNSHCDPEFGLHCFPNLFCSEVSKKCIKDNTYSRCSIGTDCTSGICVNEQCAYFKNSGDSCYLNEECKSQNCISNICRGKKEGITCDPMGFDIQDCDYGLFCDSQTAKCIKEIEPEKECVQHLKPYYQNHYSSCVPGYFCDFNDSSYEIGYCRKIFSGVENSQCGSSLSCQLGYGCQDFECKQNPINCDLSTKHCSYGQYCACDGGNNNEGECVNYSNLNCQSVADEFIHCLEFYGLSFEDFNVDLAEIYQYCFNEIQSLQCCFQKDDGSSSDYFLSESLNCAACNILKNYKTVSEKCSINDQIYCYPNLWCNSNTGECEKDNTGDKCSKGNECYSGVCIGDKCSNLKTSGESCIINEECLSNNCDSKMCKGKLEGEACDPTTHTNGYECNKGLFCDSQTNECTMQLNENEDCLSPIWPNLIDLPIICKSGFICDHNYNYTFGSCKSLYSVNEEEQCGSSKVCKLGLTCQNERCRKHFKTCNLITNHCPDGSYCNCSGKNFSGNCIQINNIQNCQSEAELLLLCSRYMYCDYQNDKNIQGTCYFENCFNQLRAYECCLNNDFNTTYHVHKNIKCNTCNSFITYNTFGKSCDLDNHRYCYDNLWCNSNTEKCEKDNTGDTCSKGNECYGGICINNKCSGMKNSGDSCNLNEECLSNNCDSKICKGKLEGEACDLTTKTNGYECNKGLFCDSQTNKCKKQLKENQECAKHLKPYYAEIDNVCSSGYICDQSDEEFSQGFCRKLYSGAENSPCGSSKSCQLGYGCQNFNCTKYIYSCDLSTKLCPWGSVCKCNEEKLYGACENHINQNCQTEVENYVNCLMKEGCAFSSQFIEGTCHYNNCYQHVSELQCCLANNSESTYFYNKNIDCSFIPSPSPTPTTNINAKSYFGLKLILWVGLPVAGLLLIIGFYLIILKSPGKIKHTKEGDYKNLHDSEDSGIIDDNKTDVDNKINSENSENFENPENLDLLVNSDDSQKSGSLENIN
ncbi:dd-gdca protein [Anaeramoeba flamelloides]|uniref:Dd-gdca protein n=1 Tax=Anaeramoeba flamelloides TaxID=1746091 RepID=A0AAV7ZTS9_9EUKA|nr:dd-gdca protein [Anaeramoeba flamelloides]